jgi:hypothetical protein
MLDPEQEALLAEMVQAARAVPRHDQKFFLTQYDGGVILVGAGLQCEVLGRDVRALVRAGLVDDVINDPMIGSSDLFVTSEGYSYYAAMRQKEGEPPARVEAEIRRLLDADRFRDTYSDAYRLWAEAEALLWDDASERNLSTIGFKLREAVQEFASTLVVRYEPPAVDPSPQATKNRIHAVINLHRSSLGDRRSALLGELIEYWSRGVDLIQRQAHSGEPGNESATWQDARSVVLHAAVLMSEIAHALP